MNLRRMVSLFFLFVFFINLGHAKNYPLFSFYAESPNEEELNWYLVDRSQKKITKVEDSLGGPSLLQARKKSSKTMNLWFIEYSSGLVGTSVLTQLDYIIVLKEDLKRPGSFQTLFLEPLRLTRWKGTQAIYKKTRPLKVDLENKRIKLGSLDEFSAKTIEIP